MPKENTSLSVHQALHGYQNGHRLLASSVDFPSADERALLIMSDLSGPRVAEGFLEYLTGYPLPSGKFYAFGKTWYATEMERPGCVWTHTLLVRSEHIADLRIATAILPFFLRPSEGQFSQYARPVGLIASDALNETDFEVLPSEIANLYSKTEQPVAIAAENGMQFERLALRVWSQQWPQLRLNFSFCTGSLSERTLASRPLDLQFGPKRIIRNFSLRPSEANVTEPQGSMAEILSDLLSSNGTEFRRFAWEVGADLNARPDFHKLAMVYRSLAVNEFCETFATVCELYPNHTSARLLKRRLLANKNPRSTSNRELLRCLLKTPSSDALAIEDADVKERSRLYYRDDPEEAVGALGEALMAVKNQIRTCYIASISEILSTRDFERLGLTDFEALVKLSTVHPDISYREEFWAADYSVQEKVELFRVLKKRKPWKIDKALEALLRARNYQAAAFIAEDLGPLQVETVLNCLTVGETELSNLLRPEWLSFLRQHQDIVVHWFAQRESFTPQMVVALAHTVLPSPTVEPLGLEKLLVAGSAAEPLFQSRHEVAAFMYTELSKYSDRRAAYLVMRAFKTLNAALAESRLTQPAWMILHPVLPDLGEGGWWDNCEKLRRSLLDLFKARQWPVDFLWHLMHEDEVLFSDILHTAKNFASARGVLLEMLEEINRSGVPIGNRQRKEIKRLLK
ncbi:MAG TPA: hypothetical protein VGH51_20045 [Candidatus Angelobacter sp.]|jgi:hypothetical protein